MKFVKFILTITVIVTLIKIDFSVEASDYIIGEEDVLQISVWKNPELSTEVVVRPDGKISLPLLDDIQAKGFTPLQLRDVITEKLKDFIEAPDITVIVRGINSFKVYVFVDGVGPQSGAFTLKRETTLLQFLAQIGGTNNIDLEKSYILRNNKKNDINLVDLIEKNDLSMNIDLLPNDTIFIHDNYGGRITVVGEVKNPKTINYRKGMTILDVILDAGGFTDFASQNATKVIRKKGDKSEEIKVKMKDIIEDRKIDKNILINPGDIVIVPEGFF
ncbi:MAG: hypothetical protein A3C43_01035 [Candidatus Schekmanbacteria bacterium RIFCSPHIGHO2_02_FULL_38_11]|nr:MAG: hypothetical protein A2043_08080 [Candidatus Schekmanbacteria bacterium GWA2_38_9]OGL50051.1 MAG: hypothetical protein A3C43_01035 [Candidatus Schekmanbacteria bacterium RIFCSPHIGHO2_02_FULL_38_11]OGL51168.1 MAG: hypothetical protein A3H37_09110 [Candidatus Schekmanbacteria bacterium RIFCSPLOWO2_02_FULL_38_14]